ncbi:MAG: hypothetical protein NTNFB02_31430 [Nitrospira sp.]
MTQPSPSSRHEQPGIGCCFLLGFRGTAIPPWLEQVAGIYGLGGVILFDFNCQTKTYDNNIHSPEQVRELCAEISTLPSRPLLFVDQEGGRVRRLKDTKGDLQMQGLQQKYQTGLACSMGLRAGLDMLCIGNNLLPEDEMVLSYAEAIGRQMKSDSFLAHQVRLACARVTEAKARFSPS